MAEQLAPPTLSVTLPGSGQIQAYSLVAGEKVLFDFDISNAVFSSEGNNLVITVERGGSVLLEGYMDLIEQGGLPPFELVNGEIVPGDVYLFAFEGASTIDDTLETAASDAPGGSGAGNYSDASGALGGALTALTALTALDGQGDLFDAPPVLVSAEADSAPVVGENGTIFYPENESVNVVLNPSFETSSFDGDRWTYLNDVNHWENTGGATKSVGIYSAPLPTPLLLTPSPSPGVSNKSASMEIWGDHMPQTPESGEWHMEIDARGDSADNLSQTIATQEGEDVTVSFMFSPRVGNTVLNTLGMDTNDFKVSLGGEEIASVKWNGTTEMWDVFTPESGENPSYSFENNGMLKNGDTDWTQLTFRVEAPSDHATLSFSEFAEHDDSYGALIDSVEVTRDFHAIHYDEDGLDTPLVGTEGDDAIFGSSRENIDSGGADTDFIDLISGGGGDDAIYAGSGSENGWHMNIIDGGAGDDFVVAGDNAVNMIVTGSGNDYIKAGSGMDWIMVDRSVLVDESSVTIDDFTDSGIDRLLLGTGVEVLKGSIVNDHGDRMFSIGATDQSGDEMVVRLLGMGSHVSDANLDFVSSSPGIFGGDMEQFIQQMIDDANNIVS